MSDQPSSTSADVPKSAAATSQTNQVAVAYTIVVDGELYVALGHNGSDKEKVTGYWTLPTEKVGDGESHQDAAARILKNHTSVVVASKGFQSFGDKSVTQHPQTGHVFQTHYLEHRISDVATLNEANAKLVAAGAFASGELKFVKASDLAIESKLEDREVKKNSLNKVRHLGSMAKIKKDEDTSSPDQSPHYRIIQTSGSGNSDCLGASIGEWIVTQALHGDPSTQDFLKKDGRFEALFDALKEQAKNAEQLYQQATTSPSVQELVEDKKVASFAALEMLPTKERQARLGAVMRTVLADLFVNDGGSNPSDAVKIELSGFKDRLLNAFDDFLENEEKFKLPDEFKFKGFDPLKEFKRIKSDSTKGTPEKKKSALQEWWDQGERINYGNAIKKPNSHLTENHAALLAASFELGFKCKSINDDVATVPNNIDSNNPAIEAYNVPGHWQAYLPKSVVDAYNQGKQLEYQIIVDTAAEAKDQAKKEERESKKKKESESQISAEVFEIDDRFFANLAAEYKPDSYSEFNFAKYFDLTDVYNTETKTMTTNNGVELTLSAVDGPVIAEEKRELVITAAKYKKPASETRNLKPEDIKLIRLNSIAAAYARSFIANGMNPNRLEIDLRKIGSDWTKDEAIKVFKDMGFKRILVNSVEELNELPTSEQEEHREETQRITTKVPVPARPFPLSSIVTSVRNNKLRATSVVSLMLGMIPYFSGTPYVGETLLVGAVLAETMNQSNQIIDKLAKGATFKISQNQITSLFTQQDNSQKQDSTDSEQVVSRSPVSSPEKHWLMAMASSNLTGKTMLAVSSVFVVGAYTLINSDGGLDLMSMLGLGA